MCTKTRELWTNSTAGAGVSPRRRFIENTSPIQGETTRIAEGWDGRSPPGGPGQGLTGSWVGPRCGIITIPIFGPLTFGRRGILAGIPIGPGTAGITAILPTTLGTGTGFTAIIFPASMVGPAGP